MTVRRLSHPNDDAFEEYAFRRLQEPELGSFEIHILSCASCRARLDDTTEFVGLIRQAAIRTTNEKTWADRLIPWRVSIERSWNRFPVATLAAAAVFAALMVWAPRKPEHELPTQTVALQTWRGLNGIGVAEPTTALTLSLDASGLGPDALDAQLVSANGRILLQAPAEYSRDHAVLRVPRGLSPGRYWVRLKARAETVREYGLVVAKSDGR